MKIMYQSFDGKFFDTQEECVKYENAFASLKMYGSKGRTNAVEEALVVCLHTLEETEVFLNKCKAEDATSDGIYALSTGMYIWDFSYDRYYYVDDAIALSLKEYFRDKFELEASSS